ncbi:uncharacterized protein TNCV_1720491 [Trichonephila clavipes]|nr:uncharacterized protein TNCV_1720491 [Trichonephila clavipes]
MTASMGVSTPARSQTINKGPMVTCTRHLTAGEAIKFSENLWVVVAVAEWSRYRIVADLVTRSSPVPLKTRSVGQRCTLNLSRAEMSSRRCGVVVRRGGVPAQMSSTSLDHDSKLRGPSPKALV